MSGGVPKRVQISRTQRNTYCKAGGKNKVQGLVLCNGKRSQKAMCNYVMKRTNIPFSRVDIKGGDISRMGDYITHTFDTPGTHILSIDILGSDYVGYELEFETLVVGGGGGGGGANADPSTATGGGMPKASAGGGGGGGTLVPSINKIKIQNGMRYQVIVGSGGLGGTGGTHFGDGTYTGGNPGSISSFFGLTAEGGEGGEGGDNGGIGHDPFGFGGDSLIINGGDPGWPSSTGIGSLRYGGGGGGAEGAVCLFPCPDGANGEDASFNEITNVALGGKGGFSDVSGGQSDITGTMLPYGGGGGGGIVWFDQTTTPAILGFGGGNGGFGGYYLNSTSSHPQEQHNAFNPVGYNSWLGGSYGYDINGGPAYGSLTDASFTILGTDYTISQIVWDNPIGGLFYICLESTTLVQNDFDSISFVSNVPGSEAHTYYTVNATFATQVTTRCWSWSPAQSGFTDDATWWADASGTNLEIFLNNDDPIPLVSHPSNGVRGGGGGGASSTDIRNTAGDAAFPPQLPTAGGNGGDGIVIISYKDPNKKKRCADGLTI